MPVNLETGGENSPGATVGCHSTPAMKSQNLLCRAVPVSCQRHSPSQHRNRLCSQLYHRLPASVWKKITEKHIWKNVTRSAPDIWSNTWPSSQQHWTLQTLLASAGALVKSRPDGCSGDGGNICFFTALHRLHTKVHFQQSCVQVKPVKPANSCSLFCTHARN